jgi:hypothetical protein
MVKDPNCEVHHHLMSDGVCTCAAYRREQRLRQTLALVKIEYETAAVHYPAFNSSHEGYAVILEELDELWAEIKKKPYDRSRAAMEREAVQIAAMAVRFILDCCDTLAVDEDP